MAGGLMQLVAYGAQDIYLTGNPQITFFKVVYRRHTNFSMESSVQTMSGQNTPSNGGRGTVTINRSGDLVMGLHLRAAQSITAAADLTNSIKDVTVEIGGQEIDKQDWEYMHIHNELYTPLTQAAGLKYLSGTYDHVNAATIGSTTGGTSQQALMTPLLFWFCRNPGLALPLIALQYHEVKVIFNWNTSQLQRATVATGVECWADYVFLDTDERRRFAQVSHEYLIEQVQMQTGSTTAKGKYKLNFNHPVKELIWTDAGTKETVLQKAKITLNGHDRIAEQSREYFQILQPLRHHTNVPGRNIKETERPVMISPIDTTILTHNSTVDDNAALLTSTTLTLDSVDQAANPIKIGDVLQIVVGGNLITLTEGGPNTISTNYTRAETNVYIVEVAAKTAVGADSVFTFTTAIPAAHLYANLDDADGMSVTIIGRTQDPSHNACNLPRNINCYSFALKPEEHQPSGTCNFSRIDTAYLEFNASATVDTIYAINYNVLRIMSGMGGLAYSN